MLGVNVGISVGTGTVAGMVAGGAGTGVAGAGLVGVAAATGGAGVGAGVGSCPHATNARQKSTTPARGKVPKRFGNTRFCSLLSKHLIY